MKILRIDLVNKVSFPSVPIAGVLYAAEGDGPLSGWTMTGTPWGVRVEQNGVTDLIPWANVKKASYDPASVK